MDILKNIYNKAFCEIRVDQGCPEREEDGGEPLPIIENFFFFARQISKIFKNFQKISKNFQKF